MFLYNEWSSSKIDALFFWSHIHKLIFQKEFGSMWIFFFFWKVLTFILLLQSLLVYILWWTMHSENWFFQHLRGKRNPTYCSFRDITMLHIKCVLVYQATSCTTQNYLHNLLSLFYLFANVRLSWKYLLTMMEIM